MGKTKLFIDCFRNHTIKHLSHWKIKHNSGKHPTVDCALEPIPRSLVKHSVGKVIPHSNLSRRERLSKFARSTPRYFKLKRISCGRSSVCRTLVEADGSSLNRQWLEFELTLYNTLRPATWRRWHNDKKLWSGQSLATEYTWCSRSWRWHSAADPTPDNNTQGLGEQMQNSNEVTLWCPQIYVSPTSKYQFV